MLQGDVDDLCSLVAITNHRPWWLEAVIAGQSEVVVQVACSTASTDAEGVRDGHIAALVRASRQGYCKPRRSGWHHRRWEEDEHQEHCFLHG